MGTPGTASLPMRREGCGRRPYYNAARRLGGGVFTEAEARACAGLAGLDRFAKWKRRNVRFGLAASGRF